MNATPARIGMSVDEVDTPALLIDLPVFERNLQRMGEAAARFGVRLRPNAKTHKCAAIARAQVAHGAIGVCCQKVSEAEAMVYGGVSDVLVTNQIVAASKIDRLAALARHARIGVCVDDADNVEQLAQAARRFGVELDVLVEINVGADRCGIAPGEPALDLARRVADAPGLRFAGVQAYHGSAQHLRAFEARRAAIAAAAEKTRATVELIERNGLACASVTGAGTGSYRFEAASGVWNELQAGSYVFMDADYARNFDEHGAPFAEFEHSLFVCTGVMSAAAPGRAVVDAGLKALSVDSGMPRVVGVAGAEYVGASDEHGKLKLADGVKLRIGDRLRLIPGHCDPTVNLYDSFVCVRDSRVEALWPIARGPGL